MYAGLGYSVLTLTYLAFYTMYAGLGYSDLTLTYLAFYNVCRAGLFRPNPYISIAFYNTCLSAYCTVTTVYYLNTVTDLKGQCHELVFSMICRLNSDPV
jgi:hypothetical protein